MKKDKNLHLRSPQVQEIIGEVPPWLVRWGLSAVFAVIVLFFCLSWFIRYPEITTATARIITTTEDVAKINLASKSEFIAEGFIDERHFHAIESGQPVHIKLTSYPFYEYGVLNGIIREKSGIQNQGKFKIVIILIDGLVTTHGRTIPYYENMTGTAEIVIQNPRLIQRILSSFSKRLAKFPKTR